MPDTNETWSCEIIDNQTTEKLQWIVKDKAVLDEMLEHCRNAAEYTQTFEIDPREGYNGVKLFNANESYTAFMGELFHVLKDTKEKKTDLGRKLEKMVLTNAPNSHRKKALAVLTIDFD